VKVRSSATDAAGIAANGASDDDEVAEQLAQVAALSYMPSST